MYDIILYNFIPTFTDLLIAENKMNWLEFLNPKDQNLIMENFIQ